MKRTIATFLATGLILPVADVFTVSQLQAQTETSAPEAFLSQADDRPQPTESGGRGDRLERLTEELNLTEDQVNQMQTIREGSSEEMQALHENLRTERETLHTLMAGDASQAELRTQHETIQTLHREVADMRFEIMLATREVLTPDQRTELAERMQQRREERRENRGFRGNRDGLERGERQ